MCYYNVALLHTLLNILHKRDAMISEPFFGVPVQGLTLGGVI